MNVKLAQNWDSEPQQQILDCLPALIFVARQGEIVFGNAEARQVMGCGEQWVPRPLEELLPDLFAGINGSRATLAQSPNSSPFQASLTTFSGQIVQIEGTFFAFNEDASDVVIIGHPIVPGRGARNSFAEDVLASLPDAVVLVRGSRVLYTNPAFSRIFGYSFEEASGAALSRLIVPETRLHEHAMLEKTIEDFGYAALDTVRMTRHGELVDVAMQIAPLLVGGQPAGHVLTCRHIGERKDMEAKQQYDATHDVLTGLPNRALFQDRANLALSRRSRRREGCGILRLDLDNLESVMATFGQAGAELLLCGVAQRLVACVRPQDTAACLGRGQFGLLLENVMNTYDLEIVAKRVLRDMTPPFEILGHACPVTVSIGVAMATGEDTRLESLLAKAELARYRASQSGSNRCEIFDGHMGQKMHFRQERERDLRQALSDRRFELWYEPMFHLASGKLEGFEAILRFRRADGSIDTMDDLSSAAEETGLSIGIGREVLEAGCKQLRDWSMALPDHSFRLALNLSHRQFYDEGLVAHLKQTLGTTRVDPSRLVLEVPEAAVNHRPDAALAMVQRMADCGVLVAIDHFGGGMAALNPLVRLPVQMVKMDTQFSLSPVKGGSHLSLIECVIHLSRARGIAVAAQGIETQQQLDAWRRIGCDVGQGSLFSPAVDPGGALEIALEASRELASHG